MMLCKFSTDGVTGVDLSHGGIDLKGKTVYHLATDTVPDDYVRVVDMDSWRHFCTLTSKDFKYYRDALLTNVVPSWDSIPDEDKKSMVGIYVYPNTFTQADIDALYSQEEQFANWKNFVEQSTQSRFARWLAAAKAVSFYITSGQAFDLYSSVKTYTDLYKDTGSPHLILWIKNGAYEAYGIDFTETGFNTKAYYTDAIRDLLVDIIGNGNY